MKLSDFTSLYSSGPWLMPKPIGSARAAGGRDATARPRTPAASAARAPRRRRRAGRRRRRASAGLAKTRTRGLQILRSVDPALEMRRRLEDDPPAGLDGAQLLQL